MKNYYFNKKNNKIKYIIKYFTISLYKLLRNVPRHSCFTNLIENNTDIRIIQKIAGHANIKTTEGYCHVSNNLLKNINLPI